MVQLGEAAVPTFVVVNRVSNRLLHREVHHLWCPRIVAVSIILASLPIRDSCRIHGPFLSNNTEVGVFSEDATGKVGEEAFLVIGPCIDSDAR